jgi:uncharacterized protein (TIGR02145 family)
MKKFFLRLSLVILYITFLGCSENAEQPPTLVTNPGNLLTDIDGNVYQTVVIGNQTWSKSNLNVSKYTDGTPIPQVTDINHWRFLTTGAWCYLENKTINGTTYGKFYNWYAVAGIYDAASAANPALRKKLVPDGWHIPTDSDWTSLTESLGGENVAGGKMKATGTIQAGTGLWYNPNEAATNESGLTCIAGGHLRSTNPETFGLTYFQGLYGFWWSSTEFSTDKAWYRSLRNTMGLVNKGNAYKEDGLSVRCVKDLPANITDVDGNVYPLVTICNQNWTKTNLNVSHYTDGTPIPQVTDENTWANLTTGAWCYYQNTTENGTTYGKLYNWYAIAGIYDEASAANPALRKKLAPVGSHIPTDAEWTTLTSCLGGENVAGGKMKATGNSFWLSPNTDANNSSGFTGLPGGYRYDFGAYTSKGSIGTWWSISEDNTTTAWYRYLMTNTANAYRTTHPKQFGFAVRCLLD